MRPRPLPTPSPRRHPALSDGAKPPAETFLALCRDDWEEERVSPHAERELHRYLECGILAHGFARARCDDCGHDFLIAFSCKGRGVCPSCNTRRMAERVDTLFRRQRDGGSPCGHPPYG